MDNLQFRAVQDRAKAALGSAKFPPRKLILIFALGLVLPPLLIDGLYMLLEPLVLRLDPDGLKNYEALLFSANGTLGFLFNVFQLFWGYCLTFCFLQISRGIDCPPAALKDGFRLWKRALGAMFWPFLRIIGLYLTFILGAGMLFLMNPIVGTAACLGFLIFFIPYLYGLWAVPYLALDCLDIPTVALCGLSQRLMRGKRMKIFLIQLRYLPYELLFIVLGMLPGILSRDWAADIATMTSAMQAGTVEALEAAMGSLSSGPSFPMNLLFLLLGSLISLLYYLWKYGEIHMTYTMAYNVLVEDKMPKNQDGTTLPEGL